MQNRLGFFGAGSMAEALLKGILSASVLAPEDIFVINRKNDDRLKFFEKTYGVNTTRDYGRLVGECGTLVIAVKPGDVKGIMLKIRDFLTQQHTIISVAAGITTSRIEEFAGKRIRVIRAMPNTSCQVKESATAIAAGRHAGRDDLEKAFRIFSSVGQVIKVDEKWLDAVTALSGSGPAYVYLMMEALTEAGMKEGLPREISYELAVQTVFGAAKMVKETGEHPVCLRKKVTSPGGTTMAGIETLERMGFTNCIIQAVNSAARRSREMMEGGSCGNS
ncbi:pyrroline-5-carboxylate reductase [Thermosediminibacter litoriperuensis]|uniref:Pyrroline-5-carboxylate reductase n=1 Tax=Thermosediminibacter litoriperuensis TaxID=291989 RepID=A0A5S5AVL3_9FIRM|nr:pyrroline-5-carboxylate reductase [Thermosediminibacter litoriperuensis]TYP57379.1 pyrroline-5-carboxylate reductase [Thermosediminibacter litoriperuensis]